MVEVTLALPYLPLGAVFGFVPLAPPIMIAILSIAAGYALVTELTKRLFFRRFGRRKGR